MTTPMFFYRRTFLNKETRKFQEEISSMSGDQLLDNLINYNINTSSLSPEEAFDRLMTRWTVNSQVSGSGDVYVVVNNISKQNETKED